MSNEDWLAAVRWLRMRDSESGGVEFPAPPEVEEGDDEMSEYDERLELAACALEDAAEVAEDEQEEQWLLLFARRIRGWKSVE